MSTITSVEFKNYNIIIKITDGQVIEAPIKYYRNLSKGTQNQINNYEIKGGGSWIHWEN